MADWISEAFSDVKTTLTSDSDDWKTWDYSPEFIPTPSIALMLGSPSIQDSEDPTFGTVQLRIVATLVIEPGDNETVQGRVNALISTSVVRLLGAGYGVEQVGQPYALEANNARYVAVDVILTTDVEPTETEGT